jgi:hypothetical protein|tara:strand:- start:308 stop:538 length:231 start_codon:yes stop_codon:yes gene_type:complete
MEALAVVGNVNVNVVNIMTKSKLNILGFPKDDPYGLVEAWWKIFTKPETAKKNESNTPKPKKRINRKTRKISRRSL